jgi:hypothetical protein
MSTRGYIAMRIVEGSMDAYQFFDFIVEDVVCELLLLMGPSLIAHRFLK